PAGAGLSMADQGVRRPCLRCAGSQSGPALRCAQERPAAADDPPEDRAVGGSGGPNLPYGQSTPALGAVAPDTSPRLTAADNAAAATSAHPVVSERRMMNLD